MTEIHPRHHHLIARAKERYQIDLDAAGIEEMALLAARASLLVQKQHSGREVRIIQFRDRPVRVVYSPVLNDVITVLPLSGGVRERPPSNKKFAFRKRGKPARPPKTEEWS